MDYKNDVEGLRFYTLAKAAKDRGKSKYYLANYFIKTKDTRRAIKELEQNISQNKKDYASMTLLAQIYFDKKELAQAMDLYEKSYQINKNYPDTLNGIAGMYLYKKDYKNALDFYMKASKKNKSDAESLIYASLCYKMLNQPDKSAEYATRAFAKPKKSAQVYYTASKIDTIKNIQYLKKAISINPMLEAGWLDLAEIAVKNNRTDLAKSYIKSVKYINGNSDKYFYYSGLINKKQGLTEEAHADFKKALELNPFFDEASKELNTEQPVNVQI
jgi:tetratricopeptide (TPR) repeat protein